MARPGEMRAAAQSLLQRRAAGMPDDVFIQECQHHIREFNTLPRPLSQMRRDALRKLREAAEKDATKVWGLAEKLGVTPNRFSRLTSREAAA